MEIGESTKRRRIFVALPISKGLEEEVSRWREKYANLPVRWLENGNLHITLVPPGYEADAPSVISKLAGIKGASLGVLFRGVSYGPDPRRPRLIWAEGGAPREMLDLRIKIYETLGKVPEKRPFLTHLTLARFKEEDFFSFPVRHIEDIVSWKERFSSFVLMESHLKRSGAEYEVLAEFPL